MCLGAPEEPPGISVPGDSRLRSPAWATSRLCSLMSSWRNTRWVWVAGSALWHSLVWDTGSQESPRSLVCDIRLSVWVWSDWRGHGEGQVRAKPVSLPTGLHFLHEEGDHEVSGEATPQNNFLVTAEPLCSLLAVVLFDLRRSSG